MGTKAKQSKLTQMNICACKVDEPLFSPFVLTKLMVKLADAYYNILKYGILNACSYMILGACWF
jgi:hypothetical protein